MRRSFITRPIAVAVSCCFASAAVANPVGPQVVSGTVSMQRPDARTLNVTNSPGAIINWQGFSISAGEITRFIQQSSSSAVLNRVVGADISQIHGQLQSNGRVFLINPAGIVIGGGAVIDTAGFVASSLNMLNADFLAGKLKFSGDGSAGSVINEGWIKASSGGNVILVAPTVENKGVIQTDGGQIVLAAGQKLTIGSLDYEGVQFEVQAPTDSALNVGKLLADGGAVGVFAGTLRHTGDIRANALTRDEAGRVVLKAQGDAIVEGRATITATGSRGGTVHVLGNRVGLFDKATLDVSGTNGGGALLIGGDYKGGNPLVINAWRTNVMPDAVLKADAIASGDGGKVIVWSDDLTRFNGSISARGGAQSGNGGFVETSGKASLSILHGRVDTHAPNGHTGKWLLDPDFVIFRNDGTAAPSGFGNNPDGIEIIAPGSINNSVASVTVQANSDVTVTDPIAMTGASAALTIQAGRSILVNADVSTNNNPITLTANDQNARATSRDAGPGEFTMAAGTQINAGTATVTITLDSGVAGSTSGNINLATISAGNISVLHEGPSANRGIFQVAGGSLRVPNGGAIHLEVEELGVGGGSSIGTSASPISLVNSSGAGTTILESHYHAGGNGIFITADTPNLQIGGATAVFPIGRSVKGVQALNQSGSGAAPGPVSVTNTNATGVVSQQTGGAACGGNSAGVGGGPICAGTSAASGNPPNFVGTNFVSLTASDMLLQAPINGAAVTLLPLSGGTIGLAGGAGTLQLANAEIAQITTNALQIGGRTASGDPTSSGNITFGGSITAPGSASLEVRTGGAVAVTGGANNITTDDAAIVVRAQGDIGSTGAGRLKVEFGTGNVTAVSQTGGIYLEQSAGDLDAGLYSMTSFSGATQNFELGTTDGTLTFAGLSYNGAANMTFFTGGANNDIFVTANGTTSVTNMTFTPARQTQFTGGTQTFNTPVSSSQPLVFAGGSAIFNQQVTGTGPTGELQVSAGTATFAAAAASSFAGPVAVSNTGILAGSGAVNANAGITFSGGSISNTGGVTTSTSLITGTPSLTGLLILAGAGPHVVDLAGTVLTHNGSPEGTVRITGTSDWLINNGARFNNAGGFLDIQSNVNITSSAGTGTLTNAGTIHKSAGGGTSTISNTITLNNTGAIEVSAGNILNLASTNTFGEGTSFNGPALSPTTAIQVTGNSTFTNTTAITAQNIDLAGAGAVYGGGGILGGAVTWTQGTFSGSFSNPGGSTWTLSGTGVKTIQSGGAGNQFNNAGTMNLTGGSLMLSGSADFRNTGQLNLAGDVNILNTGAVIFRNRLSNLAKTAGTGIAQIGSDSNLAFDNGSGAQGGTINVMANTGTVQMNGRLMNGSPALFPTVPSPNATNGGLIALGANTTFSATAAALANNAGSITLATGATLSTQANPFTNSGTTTLTNGIWNSVNRTIQNTGALRGTGTVNVGNQFVVNQGSVSPGASPGFLDITGSYSQSAPGVLVIDLTGTTPGTQHDQLRVSGSVFLGGDLHVLMPGFSGAGGNTYDIIVTPLNNAISGNFTGTNYPAGVTFQTAIVPGSTIFQLTQAGTSSGSSSSGSSTASTSVTNTVMTEEHRTQETKDDKAEKQVEKEEERRNDRRASTQQCS